MVPMCTIGMDDPHVHNKDGWSPCIQSAHGKRPLNVNSTIHILNISDLLRGSYISGNTMHLKCRSTRTIKISFWQLKEVSIGKTSKLSSLLNECNTRLESKLQRIMGVVWNY